MLHINTYRIRVIIATLSLVTMSSAFIQTSFSQEPTSNSSLSASATPSQMKYETAKEQFLKVWDTLEFEPRVATFVNGSEVIGNGQYQEHSNVFAPGEDIVLYVQPIGFGHKQIQGQNGEKLYSMNFTADIVLSTTNGTIIGGGQDIPISKLISNYRNTELFATLTLTVPQDASIKGDYISKYTLKDQTTGKSFDITKDVTIS
ncbi:MAG: hypothetical protein M3530_00445 [Thermoproteota archaeon]|nr:hypothetical protein [Thermoproteota archaeon]